MAYKKNNHPEKKNGEVLLGSSDERTFKYIAWSSKRRGKVAYDIRDKPRKSKYFPVFVQRRELVEHGINPDNLL